MMFAEYVSKKVIRIFKKSVKDNVHLCVSPSVTVM